LTRPRRWLVYLGVAAINGFLVLHGTVLYLLGAALIWHEPILKSLRLISGWVFRRFFQEGYGSFDLAAFIAGAWCGLVALYAIQQLDQRHPARVLLASLALGTIQFAVAVALLPFPLEQLLRLRPWNAVTSALGALILLTPISQATWVEFLLGGLISGGVLWIGARICAGAKTLSARG